eukprot:jgi/Tetstr1/447925/TSEL_035233.t2
MAAAAMTARRAIGGIGGMPARTCRPFAQARPPSRSASNRRAFPRPPAAAPGQRRERPRRMPTSATAYDGNSMEAAAVAGPGVELPAAVEGEDAARVVLFGVDHLTLQPEIAEFILRERPQRVVVETAPTPEMMAATGSELRAGEPPASPGPHVFQLQMWNMAAAQLASPAWPNPLDNPMWGQLTMQFDGEQLAYIAAFAVGATLVYGDRSKDITYKRLLSIPSIEDLDVAFADQSAANYLEMINGSPPPVTEYKVFTQVMMAEREAVLCSAMADAAAKSGPGSCVVGVVGNAHMDGMQRMWHSGQWRPMLDQALAVPDVAPAAPAAQASTASPSSSFFQDVVEEAPPTPSFFQDVEEEEEVCSKPSSSDATQPSAGVKRALLECAVRLYCPPAVVADLQNVLGPVPPEEEEAYSLTHELYGSPRMLMAVLPEELLPQVCAGLNTDMWQLLAPLRALRPVNGGPGYDIEEVKKLRTLNYQLN